MCSIVVCWLFMMVVRLYSSGFWLSYGILCLLSSSLFRSCFDFV